MNTGLSSVNFIGCFRELNCFNNFSKFKSFCSLFTDNNNNNRRYFSGCPNNSKASIASKELHSEMPKDGQELC